jgi:hypothetical protein
MVEPPLDPQVDTPPPPDTNNRWAMSYRLEPDGEASIGLNT